MYLLRDPLDLSRHRSVDVTAFSKFLEKNPTFADNACAAVSAAKGTSHAEIFRMMDADRSGLVETHELSKVIQAKFDGMRTQRVL